VLQLLSLQSDFIIIVREYRFLVQVLELHIVLELGQSFGFEVLLVNKGPQVVVSQQLVLVSDGWSFVIVLLAHCLESILGVDVFSYLSLRHICPVVKRNESLVVRENTHRDC
jgi:hypothetical protein